MTGKIHAKDVSPTQSQTFAEIGLTFQDINDEADAAFEELLKLPCDGVVDLDKVRKSLKMIEDKSFEIRMYLKRLEN